MRGFAKLACMVLTAAIFMVSCKKDENTGALSFNSPAVYISTPGGTATVDFTAYHVKSFYISNKPTGWSEPELDVVNRKLTIKAPVTFEGTTETTGDITLVGYSYEGTLLSTSVFVGVIPTTDLSDDSSKVANCYIATQKDTRYTFDATLKGDGVSRISPSTVKVIWQTAASLVQYVNLEQDGKASFYLGNDAATEPALKPGNALFGAYDADGELLWSWHVWVAGYNPSVDALEYPNGYTVMNRNLGALKNANSTNDEILASYGLYYQWGRKDPFVGPADYKASNGSSATMYNVSNTRVYLTFKASDATVGTVEYAAQNPMTYITGVGESENDWVWSGHTDKLWADAKTVNDPCPYGWRVASAEAFSGLSIADDLGSGYEAYEGKYGWTLTSGGVSSLYMGVGSRIYTNGTIQNVYNVVPADPNAAQVRNTAMEAQPWVGYYWTTKMGSNAYSDAFYFWFDKSDVAKSGVTNDKAQYRATGMPVRCVKIK